MNGQERDVEGRICEQASELRRLMEALMRAIPREAVSREHPFPDLELSIREVRVLQLLGERGEMMMTDLATAIHTPLSTMTRIVDRLGKKGLIERSRSGEDRRVVLVQQSEKGKVLETAARGHQTEMATRMLRQLASGEREIFLEFMAKLIRGLEDSKIGTAPG